MTGRTCQLFEEAFARYLEQEKDWAISTWTVAYYKHEWKECNESAPEDGRAFTTLAEAAMIL